MTTPTKRQNVFIMYFYKTVKRQEGVIKTSYRQGLCDSANFERTDYKPEK